MRSKEIHELWILPGFLGRPNDFDAFKKFFGQANRDAEIQSNSECQVRIFDQYDFPNLSLNDWADYFLTQNQEELKRKNIALAGYSMGGRLALHVLKKISDLKSKNLQVRRIGPASYIFISTNPGFAKGTSVQEIQSREKSDSHWSQRFQTEDWSQVLQAWNQQEVFKNGVQEPTRHESDHDKNKIVWSLREWSLSKQEDFRAQLLETKEKILLIAGDRDIKYSRIVDEFSGKLVRKIIPDAGHRIHFDQPALLAKVISNFLIELD